MAFRAPTLLLLACVASAFGGCAGDPELAPEAAARLPLKQVVVAPLNVAVRPPSALEGKGDPLWQALLGYFQERDRQVGVLSPGSAERLWREATAGLDLSDRRAALRSGYSRFAQQLARERDFDVLVIPSLVLRPAYLSGWHASWDGVQRIVPNAALLMDGGIAHLAQPGAVHAVGLRGTVPAISLHVSVLLPDGTHLHDGFGGVDVLQEAQQEKGHDARPSFATRSEPFADRESVREGVKIAFEGSMAPEARGR